MKLQIDKMAHFGIGGTITAILTLISILQEGCPSVKVILLSPIIGHVCTFILSYIKEYIIDDTKCWGDIWAAMIGSLLIHVSVGIGVLFNIWSNL